MIQDVTVTDEEDEQTDSTTGKVLDEDEYVGPLDSEGKPRFGKFDAECQLGAGTRKHD
jgi:hypothetical protein